jgi:predicted small secreted protein
MPRASLTPILLEKITLAQWSRSGDAALEIPDRRENDNMLQKVTTVVLLGVALTVAACNTVRGAAKDVNSVANCTENTMNGQTCGH